MTKLLITRGADMAPMQEYIRFDIRSNNVDENKWAALKVRASDEMIPFQCFEVEKDMLIEQLCSVIDLLKEYLGRVQKE